MKTFDEAAPSRLQIDLNHCQLAQADLERLRAEIDDLARLVDRFPISDFRLTIEYNSRTTDYSVKVALILPGTTLVANDHDLVMHAAFERCLDSLRDDIRAYKERLGQVPDRQAQQQGTAQDVVPVPDPDPQALDAAVEAGDYPAFRAALLNYEESLRKRVGRWVERYPDLAARIDRGVKVADLVEEVFLMAFEEYPRRRGELRFGEWLEGLIDPAVRALRARGDEELENISLARSAVEAQQGPEAI
jgi:ribosome-associated translation inhibitor RaiA